jgi:hypothetical protein
LLLHLKNSLGQGGAGGGAGKQNREEPFVPIAGETMAGWRIAFVTSLKFVE